MRRCRGKSFYQGFCTLLSLSVDVDFMRFLLTEKDYFRVQLQLSLARKNFEYSVKSLVWSEAVGKTFKIHFLSLLKDKNAFTG